MALPVYLYLIIVLVTSILLGGIYASRSKTLDLPRLQDRPWLFGLDTLVQDMLDLKAQKTSDRQVLRHDSLGQTYRSDMLGATTIHTIHPENIVAVTTSRFSDFGKGANMRYIIASFIGPGVMVNDGDAWKTSRALLKPLFKRNRRADMAMFRPHADALLQRISEQGYVDFKRNVQMAILDITTDLLSLEDSGKPTAIDAASNTSSQQRLLDQIDQIEPYAHFAMRLGPLSIPLILGKIRKGWQVYTGLKDFFLGVVAKRPHAVPSHTSMSESFVARLRAQGVEGIELWGAVQNIFFAAFDTSSALLTNLFDAVSRNPTIWAELRREVDTNLAGQHQITEPDDLTSLAYLRATIYETLRMYGPVKGHSRTAVTDTMLPYGPDGECSLAVPKGTTVAWSTYALNRSPAIYKDPEAFKPERWLTTGPDGLVQLAPLSSSFMPFGSGPRNCQGQGFALMMVTYIAARILSETDQVELKDSHVPFREASAVPLYNGNGTFLKFSRCEKEKMEH